MQLIRGKRYLKQIFAEWYEPFTKTHPTQIQRASIPRNVEKMLKCGTEEMGFHHYQCSNCRYEKKVAHTCKSRFCSSCGVRQTDMWIARYTSLFANCQYQHVIFAPPHEFLNYFRVGRKKYFNCLYSVVNQTLTDWYTYVDDNKHYYLPGFMMVMHTFGRSLSWHVHIHVLITCGGLDTTQTRWVPCNFIPHEFLKWHFRKNFLEAIQVLWNNEDSKKIPHLLRVWFTPSYQQNIVAQVRKKKWFVHIGERLTDAKRVVRYIGRYTKRPAIAESKILAYDGECVTFTYQEHRMTRPELLRLSALAFIERVILHIPDVNFRIIRYGGFYANRLRGKLLPIVFAVCKNKESYLEVKQRLQNTGSWWRKSIERYTRLDPLFCELCLIPLTLVSVVYLTRPTDTYG
jgi:putative transposase/transposase-like zinc-binding protein